jgi:hypothetical protein
MSDAKKLPNPSAAQHVADVLAVLNVTRGVLSVELRERLEGWIANQGNSNV